MVPSTQVGTVGSKPSLMLTRYGRRCKPAFAATRDATMIDGKRGQGRMALT